VAEVEPLDLAASVLAGAPLVRAFAVAGPPDLAAPVVGASPPVGTQAPAGRRSEPAGVLPDAGAARSALEAAVSSWRTTRSALRVVTSSGGVAPVDNEDVMASASN